jgi:hypothetical protein
MPLALEPSAGVIDLFNGHANMVSNRCGFVDAIDNRPDDALKERVIF